MSVSADEKVRIALKLDELGVHYIEGGFPASNPKELAFFERMRGVRLQNAELVAFGTTRRRGVKAEDDAGLRLLAEVWPHTVTIVGKTWGLHLTQVLHVSRDENLRMIADSVRYLVGAGKQVIYDAEHFFDAYAEDPDYAVAAAQAAADAGAALVCLCDTNGAALPPQVAAVVADVHARVGVPLGMHVHNDGDCAVANSLVAVASRRDPGAGHHQRLRRALRQRQPHQHHPGARPQDGPPGHQPAQLEKLSETAHFVSSIVNVPLDSAPALRRPHGVRPQGRPARRRRGGRPADLRARRPLAGRQRAAHPHQRAERQGRRAAQGPRDGPGRGGRRRARGRHPAPPEGPRAQGLPVRGGRRLLRALPAPDAGAARAVLPPRELPRDRREARGRQGRGGGDDQAARGRRAHHQHRRGQRPGQRAGRRPAQGDPAEVPAPQRHRAGQLPGAHPGRGARHRRHHAGAAGRQRRRARAGAPPASPRTSSRRAGRRWSTPSSTGCCTASGRRGRRGGRPTALRRPIGGRRRGRGQRRERS